MIIGLSACVDDQKPMDSIAHAKVKIVDYTLPLEINENKQLVITGAIKTPDNYLVNAQLNGTVQQLYVSKGSRIEKNQLLARIKDVQFLQKLDQINLQKNSIEARIKELNSALNVAKENLDEALELFQDSLISQDQFTQYKLEAERLEAERFRTEIQLSQSEKDEILLNNQKDLLALKSPVSGIVTNVYFKSGESISAGQSLMAIKPDTEEKVFIARVSDRQIASIQLNDSASIEIDALEDLRLSAYVSYISAQNLDKGPFYEVQLDLLDAYENILPGYFGKATIVTGEVISGYTLPIKAAYSASRDKVKIILAKRGRAVLQELKLKAQLEAKLVVDGKISIGDTVIINANGIIQPGDSIQFRQ